jgi:gliding motility-associated-like protein
LKNLKTILFFLFIVLTAQLKAQLTITDNLTATQLAQIIAGPNVSISNAVLKGSPIQSGKFNSSGTVITIDSGIVLTSGRAKTQGFTNGLNGLSTSSASNVIGGAGDADLTAFSGRNTMDANILEFDFIPLGDSLTVNYIFTSDEYVTYTCCSFNDVFAFLLTGPGYPTPTNIAKIPGTDFAVTVNSINDGIPGPSCGGTGNCTSIGAGAPFTSLYQNNRMGMHLTHNGLTVTLTASAKVEPCKPYHIKLGIADAVDASFDTGVFIEAGSFKVAKVSLLPDTVITQTGINALAENCLPTGKVKVKLANPATRIQTYNLQYGGTATPGIDYTTLPATLTFNIGEQEKDITINVLTDAIPETNETLIIMLRVATCVSLALDSVTINLRDGLTTSRRHDTLFCKATTNNLVSTTPSLPTTYIWNTGATSNSISISNPGTYFVTSTNNVTCVHTDSFNVIYDNLTLNLGADTSFCSDTLITLNSAVNQTGVLNYNWQTGETSANITTNLAGNYIASVTNSFNCKSADTVSVTIRQVPIVNLGPNIAICANENAIFNATHIPGTSYLWSNGNTLPSLTTNQPGTYWVNLTLNNCTRSDTVVLTVNPLPIVYAGNDTTVLQGGSILLQPMTSNNTVGYNWLPNLYLNNNNIKNALTTPAANIEYTLQATSDKGCQASDKVKVAIIFDIYIPNTFTPNNDGVNDIWELKNFSNYVNGSVQIFNRSGQIVYESIGYKIPFKGSMGNKDLPAGTYYYVIKTNNIFNNKTFTGYLTILR